MPLYWVLSEPREGIEISQILECLPEHLRHQFTTERQGKLFAAGPLGTIGKDPPVGFYVLIAETEEEAMTLANEDPMHKQGLKTFKLRLWNLHESSILGVGVRAMLNGTSSDHPAYWPDRIEEHSNLPQKGANDE